MPTNVHLMTALGACALLCACSRPANVDKVPVGTEVQVTRSDGALVEGTLAARDATTVTVNDGHRPRTVPRDEIRLINVVDMNKPAEVPAAARFREVRIPATTPMQLRLETSLSSVSNSVEDPVIAELVEPITIDGVEVVPVGTRLRGVVTQAVPSGKVKGRASLAFRFPSISARGETHAIDARFARTAPSTKTKDAEKIGIPAAAGGAIGALLGGGKGAAAGAAIGGGAGTALVLTTPGKNIELPSGTMLSLAIGEAIDVRVPVRPGDPDKRQIQ
jgi:hypothetical protein